MFDEELVAEIFCRNLITEILLAINIRYTCGWLNDVWLAQRCDDRLSFYNERKGCKGD